MSTIEASLPIAPSKPAYRWRSSDLVIMTIASLVLFFVLLIGATIALIIGMGINPSEPSAIQSLITSLPFTIATGISSFVALVGAVWAVGTWRKRGLAELGLIAVPRRTVLLAFIAALGLRLFTIPLVFVLQALGFPMDNPQLSFMAPEGFSVPALVAILIIAGILIPFAEELFFRGVLYTWLRERWGMPVGMLVSALVFGAVHGHPTIGTIAFFLGLASAFAYQRSSSLWASVILHGCFNILAIVMLYAALATGMHIPGM